MAKANDPPAQANGATTKPAEGPPAAENLNRQTPTKPNPPAPAPPKPPQPNTVKAPPLVKGPRFEQAKAINDFQASVLEWMQTHDPALLLALLERGERAEAQSIAELPAYLDEYLADRTKAWHSRIRVRINDHQTPEAEAMRLAAKDLFPPEETPADQLDPHRLARLEKVLRALQERRAESRPKSN